MVLFLLRIITAGGLAVALNKFAGFGGIFTCAPTDLKSCFENNTAVVARLMEEEMFLLAHMASRGAGTHEACRGLTEPDGDRKLRVIEEQGLSYQTGQCRAGNRH